MARKITQQERQNESENIRSLPEERALSSRAATCAFVGAPAIDFERFRADVDAFVDDDPTPRG
jgi:hypothetical protein